MSITSMFHTSKWTKLRSRGVARTVLMGASIVRVKGWCFVLVAFMNVNVLSNFAWLQLTCPHLATLSWSCQRRKSLLRKRYFFNPCGLGLSNMILIFQSCLTSNSYGAYFEASYHFNSVKLLSWKKYHYCAIRVLIHLTPKQIIMIKEIASTLLLCGFPFPSRKLIW